MPKFIARFKKEEIKESPLDGATCLFPICMEEESHAGQRFEAMIHLFNAHSLSISRLIVLITGTLDMYRILIDNSSYSIEQARTIAEKGAERWLDKHRSILRQLDIKLTIVYSWGDWSQSDNYIKQRERIEKLYGYEQDPTFKQACDDSATKFLERYCKRKGMSIDPKALEYSLLHVKDECAMLAAVHRSTNNDDKYTHLVYPGPKDKAIQYTLKKLLSKPIPLLRPIVKPLLTPNIKYGYVNASSRLTKRSLLSSEAVQQVFDFSEVSTRNSLENRICTAILQQLTDAITHLRRLDSTVITFPSTPGNFLHNLGRAIYLIHIQELFDAIKKLCATDRPDITYLSTKADLEEAIFFLRLQQLFKAIAEFRAIDNPDVTFKSSCLIRLEQLFDAISEVCTIDSHGITNQSNKDNFRRGLFFTEQAPNKSRDEILDLALNSLVLRA